MHRCSSSRGDSSSTPPPTEEWPPTWKPIEESPQFKYGMITEGVLESPYENCEPLEDWQFPISKHLWTVKDSHYKLKRYIRQLRASRGYDVDVLPPEVIYTPFDPVPLSYYTACETMGQKLTAKVNFVVSEMNSQAQQHRKLDRFEFHELVKVVEARPHRCSLITFTVKEVARRPVIKTVQAMVYNSAGFNFKLEEWRFKPQNHDQDQDGDGDGDGDENDDDDDDGGDGGGDESGSGYGYGYDGGYGQPPGSPQHTSKWQLVEESPQLERSEDQPLKKYGRRNRRGSRMLIFPFPISRRYGIGSASRKSYGDYRRRKSHKAE